MKAKKIDEKTVKHVARLSRLSLPEEDSKKFSEQLSAVLDYINKLNEIDTSNVSATSHTLSGIKNVFREDRVKESLDKEEVLKNAPKKSGDFFAVPKIIE
ncbi:MAG: Asp-tRNA(Asn)/Glu-tRNA(Gln) amidotransferase subunit GatC [Candidatus Omnitrophica bacterium]|nr:Asp-tRNA(Asn)/Glu-tRNA(Gln) amidotransferase subunit GatC [Candidatus Omnitrophota bacterium]